MIAFFDCLTLQDLAMQMRRPPDGNTEMKRQCRVRRVIGTFGLLGIWIGLHAWQSRGCAGPEAGMFPEPALPQLCATHRVAAAAGCTDIMTLYFVHLRPINRQQRSKHFCGLDADYVHGQRVEANRLSVIKSNLKRNAFLIPPLACVSMYACLLQEAVQCG